MIKQFGKLALPADKEASSDTITISDDKRSDESIVKDFGSILQVIELYNLVMPSFEKFLARTALKHTPLEYGKLLQVLFTDPSSDENKSFYVDLIRRFLLIFIYNEKQIPVRKLVLKNNRSKFFGIIFFQF